MNESIFFNSMLELISKSAPEVAEQVKKELEEQRCRAKLIASENYNSLPVLAAMSSLMVDKYSEGVVGKRYYSGCEQVDAVEQMAIDYAKKLFGAEYAYVQPCSGSDANLIAYYAIVKKIKEEKGNGHRPKLLSLDVACGGHLTHSNPMNIVNELFDVITYKVEDDGWLDYDKLRAQANEVKPDVLLAGYSAYPRKLNFKIFKEIADNCGALLMCDMAHFAGMVAGKVFTEEFDPIPYCEIVTSTTQKTLRAGRGGIILAKADWESYINRGCPIAMGGPLNNMTAAKAVGFKEALKPEFREYAQQVVKNCKALADTLKVHSIVLQTDGTDNHLVLLNLAKLGITGKQAEDALLECNIVTNRNSIPNDSESPLITSGLRIGPAALTTRGLKEEDMIELGKCIAKVLLNLSPVRLSNGNLSKKKYELSASIVAEVKERVANVLCKHPLYPELN